MCTSILNRCFLIGILWLFNTTLFANSLLPITAILGMGTINTENIQNHDGEYQVMHLAYEKIFKASDNFVFGFEFSVENGNAMRLQVPKSIVNQLGGMPFKVNAQPMMDFLGTVKTKPNKLNTFGIFKMGFAHRYWQYERCSSTDLRSNDLEIQSGFGYQLNSSVTLQILGRYISGQRPHYSIDPHDNELMVSSMPSQYGVLFATSLELGI